MHRPAAREIPYLDPLRAFAPFAADPFAVLLDSAEEGGGRGRYSYIAVDPVDVLTVPPGGEPDDDPFTALKAHLGRVRLATDPDLPPFQCGLCGLLGYELGRALERLPAPNPGPAMPAMAAGLFDTVAAFDTFSSRAWIVAADVDGSRPSSVRRIDALAERLAAAPPLPALAAAPGGRWRWEMDGAAYRAAVARAVDYIHAGDIFQANITTRAVADMPAGLDPFMLYRRLRWASAAPFAAFVACAPGTALLGASPERFLRLAPDGRISTRPIKGTRPRGDSPELDAALAVELTESVKDRAENLMIVDLLRNDLSRVALIGSVEAGPLFELETFAKVHHLVSEVRARLRPGFDAVDLIRAAFPGGSVTGAPKVRAMEIIHELEPSRRGAYCGSVFWAGFDGAMDSNIVIRSLSVAAGEVSANAGGGIVADSRPEEELDEMLTKARPLLRALDGGDGA